MATEDSTASMAESNSVKLNRIAASLAGVTSILNMFARNADGGVGDALYLVSEQTDRLNMELGEIALEIGERDAHA